jgi:hypothetical protein
MVAAYTTGSSWLAAVAAVRVEAAVQAAETMELVATRIREDRIKAAQGHPSTVRAPVDMGHTVMEATVAVPQRPVILLQEDGVSRSDLAAPVTSEEEPEAPTALTHLAEEGDRLGGIRIRPTTTSVGAPPQAGPAPLSEIPQTWITSRVTAMEVLLAEDSARMDWW